MKRSIKLLALALTIAFPAIASAGISGSPHDFSGAAWVPNTEICVACHTPHNADTSVAEAPLWNHLVTTQTFTPYSNAGGTLQATVGQPTGISKLCLSCHDGVTNLDAIGGGAGSTAMAAIPARVGTDLSNDHPISFAYSTALSTADGELADPAVATSGLGGTIAVDMLFAGQMECASCHDVHNAVANPSLLRKSNAGSALCLTCHTK